MTCKDCIHYVVCKRIDYELEYHNKSIAEAEKLLAENCRLFNNKADMQEIKHGKWIWTESGEEDYEQYYVCSICKEKSYFEMKFCPDCGAKMNIRDEIIK